MARLADIFRDGVYPRFHARLVEVDDAAMTIRVAMPFRTEIRAWREGDRIETRTTVHGRSALKIGVLAMPAPLFVAVLLQPAIGGTRWGQAILWGLMLGTVLVFGYGKNILLVRDVVRNTARRHWLAPRGEPATGGR